MSILDVLTCIRSLNVTKSDSTVYDPPLFLLIALPDAAGGTIVARDELENVTEIEIDASLTAPVFIPGRFAEIMAATDFDTDYLIGIQQT
jgi:hypothetical protein